jgi:hypothetical protein
MKTETSIITKLANLKLKLGIRNIDASPLQIREAGAVCLTGSPKSNQNR